MVETLLAARTEAGLKQSDLASRVGRDQTFISLIERRQRRVDVVDYIALAKAMNLDPAALFADLLRRMSEGDGGREPRP